jgi:Flp pilus assembly protein TadB
MQDQDVLALDESERKLLDLSFQRGMVERRIRNIVFDVAVTSAVVIIATAYGLRTGWLAAVAVALLVIAGVEKISYARSVMHYTTLVRKLVHRVEQLEGTQQTGLGAHPAEALQHRLDRERELQIQHEHELQDSDSLGPPPVSHPTHH